MKTNRYILSLLLLVVSAFNLLPANAQQNQYAIYNYRNDGDFNAWLNIDVDSITYSCIDTFGVEHDDVVVQEVWTPDSVYRIPINAIDSIRFRAPKPIMRDGLFYLREYHATHTVKIDSLTLYFDTSIRNDSLPLVGQVVLNGTYESPYEEGFAGRVVHIERLSNSIKVECEMIAVGDVYKRLVLVGKGMTESANNTSAKIKRANGDPWIDFQETDVKTFKNLGDLKVECLNGILSITSKDPTLVVGYYVYVDELFYSMSVDCSLIHHDIESKVTLSIEKIKELAEVSGDIAETIKRLKDFKNVDQWLEDLLKEKIDAENKEKESEDEINLIEHLWKKANFSKSIPIAGPLLLDLELGPLLKLKGDVEYVMTLKNKARQSFHLSAKGNTMTTLSNPSVALLTGAASVKGHSTFDSDPFHSMSINAAAKGSLSVGITGKIGLSLIHKNVVHANLSAQGGLKASAALNVKYMDTAVDENDWTPYEAIKDTKIKLEKFAKAGVELGVTKSKFFTWGAEWEFWSKDVGVMHLVPHFSQPALPTYEDGQWSNGNWNNHLVLQSLPTKDIPDLFLGPCKVALRIVDEQGKVVKDTKEREYRDDGMKTWQINPLEVDLSDLTPGKKYRCYPTLHYWNMKPAQASPSYEFTIPYPVSIENTSVTLNPDDVRQIPFVGGWGDYQILDGDNKVATASLKAPDGFDTGAGGGGGTSWGDDIRYLYVLGKEVGETTITLKDLRSNETTTLNVTVSDEVIPNLALSETSLTMETNGTAEVAITSGSGSYTVANSNEEVAVAAISNDNKVSISALKAGTAAITVTDTKTLQTAEITVTVTDPAPTDIPAEAIDLGLPSGTLWASYNVGATKPEEYGSYFAWGETQEKKSYYFTNYSLCDGTVSSCHNIGYDISGTKYDVAHVRWGNEWCMPSKDDFYELTRQCEHKETTVNGVKGYQFTGPNGKSIFLPYAGYFWNTENSKAGTNGSYWSSTLTTSVNHSQEMSFSKGEVLWDCYINRFAGLSVRPVKRGNSTTPDLSLESTSPVNLEMSQSSSINIISGSGSYTAISSAPDVATAEVNNATVVITAHKAGTATITVTDTKTKQTATIAVTVTDGTDMSPGEAIDLGLPSGTLWASCNVGATKPEEYGLYFAWGETKGYTSDTSDGHSFNWSNYKLCNGSSNSLTKYTGSDGKTELDLEDDAAYVNWGSNWRMPSRAQQDELRSQCTWTWTQLNGVNGYRVTSKTNGNSIFLPAAGWPYDTTPGFAGPHGNYWSRSLNTSYSDNAYYLVFYSGRVGWYGDYRCYGTSVRPVRR